MFIYICIIVIILNVLIFVYYFITNNNLKKQIDENSNTLTKSIDSLKNDSLKLITGSNDGYVNGPFKNIAPTENAHTFIINVPIKGNYILNICASSMDNNVAMIALGIWINGVLTKYRLKGWVNEEISHHTLIPISFKYTLNKGNNYIYLQHVKNLDADDVASISDANDFASINWIYSP